MPCFHPVTAWRSREVNQGTGKRPLVFSRDKGQEGSKLQIPCGNCIGCRLDRARSWSTRIMHERREHELCVFLTLTYNDHYLPKDGSLVKKHMQDFFKRLRRNHEYHGNDNKLKYYMCGEYGGKTNRPHYHAIVFGIDFADKRKHNKGKRGDQIYTSAKLNELWGMGYCWIGSVTHQSAGYVARYCIKKINGEQALEHYQRINSETGEITRIIPEFMACSRGLGEKYFTENHEALYKRGSCIVEGKETPIPKYYDRKLESINPELLEQVKAERKAQAKKRKADNTPERLAVRKEIKERQSNLLVRELE